MAKVKVLYGYKTNAWLGGKLFTEGEAVFDDEAEGIQFAEMYHLKYKKVPVKRRRSVKK